MIQKKLHIVEQLLLDVDYFETESARKAQSHISRLASNNLTHIFERVCNKYGANIIYKMRKVHFDLGDIPEDILDHELLKRFEKKLTWIMEALSRGEYIIEGVEGFELQHQDDRIIEGFIYYLNYGIIPYYLENVLDSNRIKDLLFHIADKKIPVFRKELRNSVTSLMAKRRIVRLFPGKELLRFFHFMLNDNKNSQFDNLFNELEEFIESHPDSYIKNEMLAANREFFVDYLLQNPLDTISFDCGFIVNKLLYFFDNKKNILPEKWIPGVLTNLKQTETPANSISLNIIKITAEKYFQYIQQIQTGFIPQIQSDIIQRQQQLMEVNEVAEKESFQVKEQLHGFIQNLVLQVKQNYGTVETDRIETVIKRIADEILPSKSFSPNSFCYWADAIGTEVKRLFGVSVEAVSNGEYRKGETVGNEISHVSERKTELTISISLAYWVMFLSAGITPFKKLYQKPGEKLNTIFSDLLAMDSESMAWQLKQHVREDNLLLVAWWIKDTLNKEIFHFFQSQLSYSLSVRVDEELSYKQVITSVLFLTGNFPWTEVSQHGHDYLVERVNDFIEELDEVSLEQFVKENKLFADIERLNYVFSIISLASAKKLTQIIQKLKVFQEFEISDNLMAGTGRIKFAAYKESLENLYHSNSEYHNRNLQRQFVDDQEYNEGSAERLHLSKADEKSQHPFHEHKKINDVSNESHSSNVKHDSLNSSVDKDLKQQNLNQSNEKMFDFKGSNYEGESNRQNELQDTYNEEELSDEENNLLQNKRQFFENTNLTEKENDVIDFTNDSKLNDIDNEFQADFKPVKDRIVKKELYSEKSERIRQELFDYNKTKETLKESVVQSDDYEGGTKGSGVEDESEENLKTKSDKEVQSVDSQNDSNTNQWTKIISLEQQRWALLTINKILDEIAFDLLQLHSLSFYDALPIDKRVNLIFQKISVAAEKSFYQAVAMLVGMPENEMSEFLGQLNTAQKDFIKKMVKSYRSRFVSMAEDIRMAEKAEAAQANLNNMAEDQTLFAKNAGMVLLNPYLMRLFKRFELIEGKEFVNDTAKEKGVYLLQYLVNKSVEPDEFELSLNKIICGIPLGVPLKTEINLTDEDKKICDGLLEAMVKNWGALKNTSADGLRTSFLMREGTIRKEPAGWKLHIEKKVYDILLEKLPWGYTMIQLPWMELPLNTVWETK